ncbi:MAG: 3-oxo-5-alpha-steroid 4-dehydrogenase, partial [Bacteroidales bacterium]|nr:3-oxo-5-alpha-steroid 4-dehydrogenase [Candidatus Cryptobacteroides aphodequi]
MQEYNIFLIVMAVVAAVVFVSLFFVDAGYGKFYTRKWGPTIGNRLGWMLMECPVFFLMLALWLASDRRGEVAPLVMLIIFETHYFQRSFIFPLLIRGKGRMPLSIIVMSVLFNSLNALVQGGWLFYFAPEGMYTPDWLLDPRFIAGTLVFAFGMYVNISSDSIIRHLRKPGDNAHYLPKGGMFRYVT